MKTISKSNIKFVAGLISLTLGLGCSKVAFTPVDSNDLQSTPPIGSEEPTKNRKLVTSTVVVAYANKQVDFLLVLDDSNSMLPELKKLAARMEGFVKSLEDNKIDWQMCLTTTRGIPAGAALEYGTLLKWTQYTPKPGVTEKVLTRGTANLSQIFNSTVNALTIGGGSSGDERGIKAAHNNFSRKDLSPCYRTGAAVSVILISDEDERSVGGNPLQVKPNDVAGSFKPLETDDLPASLLQQAQSSFGSDVRFTFSSIIVKPGDSKCEKLQDLDTSPSHPGYVYEQMSILTDGGIGSICDEDYSTNLNNFKNKIVNSLSSLTLECSAIPSTVKIKIGDLRVPSFKIDGNVIRFAYPLVEGTVLDLEYECEDSQKTTFQGYF